MTFPLWFATANCPSTWLEAWAAPTKIAKFVSVCKNAEDLIAQPKSRRGKLQKMPVRIAEVDDEAARRPLGAPLYLVAGTAQPLLPGRQLIGRYRRRRHGC